MERQIEEILRRKGISPKVPTDEELTQKIAERVDKLFPKFVATVVGNIVDEELARVGRSKRCRYWGKGGKGCSKGIATCRIDCDSYKPCPWWQQMPYTGMNSKFITYAMEGLCIGACVGAGIIAFLSPSLLRPVVYLWLVVVIVSRMQIMYQWRILRRNWHLDLEGG